MGPAPCITSIPATEDMLAKTLNKRVPKLMTSMALGVGDSEVKEKEGPALAKNAEVSIYERHHEVTHSYVSHALPTAPIFEWKF
jgi:hypothetical protein